MSSQSSESIRWNPMKVQMINKSLRDQIFGKNSETNVDDETVQKCIAHLIQHSLWGKKPTVFEDVNMKIPSMVGGCIGKHFSEIALQHCSEYFGLANKFSASHLPPKPKSWVYRAGWLRYDKLGNVFAVSGPMERILVFDIETCVNHANVPTLACCASSEAWYGWVSPYLVDRESQLPTTLQLSDLVPFGGSSDTKRLILGHNVSFDRSFLRDQYNLKESNTYFLDTMSLHISISGLTAEQRNAARASDLDINAPWMEVGSLNNLADVYKLYTQKELIKSPRNVFVSGTMEDVRNDFQNLMDYCASDVSATFEVFTSLWPLYLKQMPSPVTFSGMLSMGNIFLTVNESWERYLEDVESTYAEIEEEIKFSLVRLAKQACQLVHSDRWKQDPWLWSLDWSRSELKTKTKIPRISKDQLEEGHLIDKLCKEGGALNSITNWYPDLPAISDVFSTRSRRNCSFPEWYRKLIPRPQDPGYRPGPWLLSTQNRITPVLLRLSWRGFPLYYSQTQAWGYLVPGRTDNLHQDTPPSEMSESPDLDNSTIALSHVFPHTAFKQFHPEAGKDIASGTGGTRHVQLLGNCRSVPSFHEGVGPVGSVDLPGVWFFKLPHSDGKNSNVGNPLSKDFLSKVEDGVLSSCGNMNALRALKLNKMISFWRNARDRISSQMVMYVDPNDDNPYGDSVPRRQDCKVGIIIPRVVVAGTISRRAVEKTWLTASNPKSDMVGSEVKSMVRSPSGYVFVGADVDSQELWIASLLGDSNFGLMHGCTALSWMTLQGSKSDKTDMHSKTAEAIGVSRDLAKVFNYARIYGSGQSSAKQLLLHNNPLLTEREAEEKATSLYSITKGTARVKLTDLGMRLARQWNIKIEPDGIVTSYVFKNLMVLLRAKRENHGMYGQRWWVGGSESEMFNMLEKIALSKDPRTPVLNCGISRALVPDAVGDQYMTSRCNWAVQSSAVDYLHLLLVATRWAFEQYRVEGRLCISIHDEVRYMVREEQKYEAAFCLHLANLLTRSMFAHRLGINDLPLSVAFFSSVDIDKVLRKEVNLDARTPSNPRGLALGHGISQGESVSIHDVLKKLTGYTSAVAPVSHSAVDAESPDLQQVAA